MTRAQRIARGVIVLLLLSALTLVLALVMLTQTERGRRLVADRIERTASDEIPGWMKIGELERIGTPTIVHELQFFHPDGRLVLRVKRAEVDFDIGAAWGGKLAFDRAKAEGGHLLISVDPDGRPSIEAALDFPTHGVDPDPDGGLHYALREIRVEDFALRVLLSKDASYHMNGVRGEVAIRRELTSGTRVELTGISGVVREEVAGSKLRLLRVDGWVHGKERKVMQLLARAKVGDGRMNAKVGLFDRDQTPVEIDLTPVEGLDSLFTALLIYAKQLFTDDIDVEVHGA
jgi:hypothetical protein